MIKIPVESEENRVVKPPRQNMPQERLWRKSLQPE